MAGFGGSTVTRLSSASPRVATTWIFAHVVFINGCAVNAGGGRRTCSNDGGIHSRRSLRFPLKSQNILIFKNVSWDSNIYIDKITNKCYNNYMHKNMHNK